VLYEMLAGEPAIAEKENIIRTLLCIVRQDVKPLMSRASWVPERLARVIDAGLVRDRDKRIPDASTLAAWLIEAVPELAHPRSSSRIERATDVSELRFDDELREEASDPARAPALRVARLEVVARRGSTVPPSSGDERVQISVRPRNSK